MDFRFTTEYSLSRLDEIIVYLMGPRLWIPHTDYPDFGEWAERSYQEIKKERKRAIIALSQDQIVGVIVYQQHKKFSESLELKNLTVRPDQRGRHIASFLIRNAEVEGLKEFKATNVLCDVKASNFGVRLFLLKHQYHIVTETDLYLLGTGNDIVFRKDLRPLLISTQGARS